DRELLPTERLVGLREQDVDLAVERIDRDRLLEQLRLLSAIARLARVLGELQARLVGARGPRTERAQLEHRLGLPSVVDVEPRQHQLRSDVLVRALRPAGLRRLELPDRRLGVA